MNYIFETDSPSFSVITFRLMREYSPGSRAFLYIVSRREIGSKIFSLSLSVGGKISFSIIIYARPMHFCVGVSKLSPEYGRQLSCIEKCIFMDNAVTSKSIRK